GPSAVRRADRVAVPLMILVGCALTWALWYQPTALTPAAPFPLAFARGFDIVVAYQVSWLLMFADYSRYTPSPTRAGVSVYAALSLTSIWFMLIGFVAARAAGSLDPGLMLDASGLAIWGAVLLTLATITTNLVNVYSSALAWRSLWPGASDRRSVLAIGAIGTLVSLLSTAWLEGYADFMLWLGSALVPIGGALIAHYIVLRRQPRVSDLYDLRGPLARHHGFRLPGMVAWLAGAATFVLAGRIGGTLPSLVVAVGVYIGVDRWRRTGTTTFPFGRGARGSS
ncbi:MAG: cytosine permease, partial [Vicinamibacterales bacterium]